MESKITPPIYTRPAFHVLAARLHESRRFIQVIAGPRQVGKTTLVRQATAASGLPVRYASADEPSLRSHEWIEQQWDAARLLTRDGAAGGAILVIDEIQKVSGWSESVKRLWDEDTASGLPLHVVLLGSAQLVVQRGLIESLAGRFEMLRLPHWSYTEMREAFGWDIERYLYYGGYPGAAGLIGDPVRWARYIIDSLIETTLSRDVLLLTRVDKPALLRRLFEVGCRYSGQILSYTKLLGQLQDTGNTTTLAHYLDLLAGAGMVIGLQKYAGDLARSRGSSPKLQVLNTALMTAPSGLSFSQTRADPAAWGRLVESAIGAHLANAQAAGECEAFYWRNGNLAVDFVVRSGRSVAAIEVKSGRSRDSFAGMEAFARDFQPTRKLLVGGNGISVEAFLSQPAACWVRGR